jgi:hypothetical protein
MKKPYCCDASRDLYQQYYTQQQKGGGDFPVHVGVFRQKGHGLGGFFASLYRRILPFIKSFAPRLLRSGAEIIDDVSKGKTWKTAVKSQLPDSITKIAFGEDNQSGNGLRRKRSLKFKKKKAKRVRRDIFS